jgi:hypothetical protein
MKMSFRVIIFYAVAVVFIAAMIITANGDLDGFWQLMQLFGGITGIVGSTNYDLDRKKTVWYIFSGLIVALLGGIVTAIIYVLMLALMMLICNDALWKELNVMCKE